MNCPRCSELLPIGVTFCECGWRDKSAPVQRGESQYRCCYETEGRRCRLRGSFAADRKRFFCSWHERCLVDGRRPDDKDAFLEFVKQRAELTAMEKVLSDRGIKPPRHEWRQDPEFLWGQMMAFL